MSFGRCIAACVAAVVVVAGLGGGLGVTVGAAPGGIAEPGHEGHYRAVIRRTEYGIPHILAADVGNVGFGYGYAFAQDNLCTLEQSVLTVSGARSQFFGPGADSGDQLSRSVSNLDSDVYYRSINASGVIEQAMSRPAPWGPTPQARQLVAGYVAGVNRYLRDTGVGRLPDPTCRAQPWVRPITETDLDRVLYRVNQFGGTAGFISLIAQAQPGLSTPATRDDVLPQGFGSNGIAIGRDATQDGHGELLANPHFPWLGSDRLYQVQLTVPGQLDVSGASLYGSPVVQVGHTTHLAWTHTVSTAQRFTLYQLHLAPGDPTSYLVDGHAEHMTKQTISVPVLTASGGQSTVTRTLYSSRYGPLLASGWTATTALAVKGANVGNVRAVSEWLEMGRAQDVTQLRAVQDRYQGIPFANTIASDSAGTAYLADASVVPHVTDAQAARCVDTPLGKAVYPHETILDGSRAACAWGSDPGAIEPGIFAPATAPALTRTDYVTNSNDSPWLTNPAAPLTGYPRIYGDIDTPRSLRTRLGLELIDQRLRGSDGLGGPGFTLSSLRRAELSDRNLSGELARDAALALCHTHPVLTASNGQAVDVSAACPVLAGWDLRGDPGSRGAVLWRQFWVQASEAADLWSVPFDAAHPATTPNTLNTASSRVRHALADAVQRMHALHLPLDEPLSAAQHTTTSAAPIAVPGCTNNEGCYNIVSNSDTTPLLGDDGQFPAVTFGSSFIMTVDLVPSGPTAHTILTYSESANPSSPHHSDQTTLFAQKRWVTNRFTEHQITTDPQLQVTVVTG